LPAADDFVKKTLPQIAFGALGDHLHIGRHGFDRFLADDDVIAFKEDDAGREFIAFGVQQSLWLAKVIEVSDGAIRCAKVDANNVGGLFCHEFGFSFRCVRISLARTVNFPRCERLVIWAN